MINKSNYELYFIDYFDGTLNAEQVAELFLFLEKHAELKTEFENFENIKLEVPTISFKAKQQLKKNIITADNFNEYAIGNIEGTLTQNQQQQYSNFIASNPTFKKEHALFQKTKLQPDATIVFSDKKLLKRGQKVLRLTPFYYAAAASVVLLIAFYFFNSITNSTPQTAHKHPAAKTQSPLIPINKNINDANTKPKAEINLANAPLKSITDNAPKSSPIKPAESKTRKTHHIPVAPAQIIPSAPIAAIPIANTQEELPIIETTGTDYNFAFTEIVNQTNQPIRSSITNAAKKLAVQTLNSIANSNVNLTADEKRKTQKLRVLDLFATVVNKVTFKKVNIQTAYTPEGQLVAYSVTAGALNYEKYVMK